ncbi:hypothetical protein [Hyphomicrobium sp.]|uniref:hypothetical protein n=1 Tax=Hyphomicrobium sp. TaxID=82 RepID=UPI0025BB0BFB|nr:hypothetical protein [Hyphomicrobium sp.]
MPTRDAKARSTVKSQQKLAAAASASPAILMASGGDKRIWLDSVSGRNRYGTLTRPAEDEISFSSSTASSPSALAFAAATQSLSRLINPAAAGAVTYDVWFNQLHQHIAAALGCAGARTILASSGTDAELLGLGIVSALSPRPLTNVFVAPDETGNGVPQAAAGRHFSDITALGLAVQPGEEIAGLAAERIEARAIAIRDEAGRQRAAVDIDADMIATVEGELKKGRDVVVHVLDTSKTGLTGVTRDAAKYAASLAPGRVRVMIDACQLRGEIDDLRDDLANGFIVLVTVSKFFAAPPFAGALLLPDDIVAQLRGASFPPGLLDYTAAQDWCPSLRDELKIDFTTEMNIGLGLRWQAGLANLQRFNAIPPTMAAQIKREFVDAIRKRAFGEDGFFIHPDDDGCHLESRAIVNLSVTSEEQSSMVRAKAVQEQLRQAAGAVCHVGQPVRVANRAVLRVALSAPHVIAVSERLALGDGLPAAMAPLVSQLDTLFEKWQQIHQGLALSDAS